MKAYKGFDQDLKCRGFQYEIGGEYEHNGKVEPCSSGFHACEYPLDVFGYYPPASSRYAEVEQAGETIPYGSDSKVVSSTLRVVAEIGIAGLVKAAVDYTISRAKPEDGSSATGPQGAASATGLQGAASATGPQGAASAAGYRGKVKGAKGNALFLCQRDCNGRILHVWAGIVGKDGIKPNTWYTLKAGKPVEVE